MQAFEAAANLIKRGVGRHSPWKIFLYIVDSIAVGEATAVRVRDDLQDFWDIFERITSFRGLVFGQPGGADESSQFDCAPFGGNSMQGPSGAFCVWGWLLRYERWLWGEPLE